MHKHTILSCGLFLCLGALSPAAGEQLLSKSNLFATEFLFNPGMTALGETIESGALHQQKWAGFDHAPRTTMAFAQFPFIGLNMSLGGYLMHDKAGFLNTNEVGLSYSYKLELGLTRYDQLSVGVLASLKRYRFDGGAVIANSYNDPRLLREDAADSATNFGAGLFYTTDAGMFLNEESAFFIGLGARQLVPTEVDFTASSQIKKVIHANALIGAHLARDFVSFQPSVWVEYAARNVLNLTASLIIEMDRTFWGGLSYQIDNTVSIQSGVILNNLGDGYLRIGVLGAYNIGSNGNARGWGYDFLVGYRYDLF